MQKALNNAIIRIYHQTQIGGTNMVIDTLKKILEDQLDIDPETISEDTNIMDDLGADSLDIVELMMSVEEEFDITIEDSDAQLFKTVGDVVNYIESKM